MLRAEPSQPGLRKVNSRTSRGWPVLRRMARYKAKCSVHAPFSWAAGTCGALLLVSSCCASALANPRDERRSLRPMPEPVLGESVTDIDGTKAGELEVDLTGLWGRGGSWATSVEIEARVLDWLGLEAGLGYSRGKGLGQLEGDIELRLLASLSLLHDFERGLHGQVEIGGRLVGEPDLGPNLGEPRPPLSTGVRLGLDRDWWTLRVGLGAAIAGGSAHEIPAWASATAFLNLGQGRWTSLGLDGEADWSRRNPFTLAPTVLVDGRILHLPGRLAVVALYGFASGGQEPWLGLILRLVGESDLGSASGD